MALAVCAGCSTRFAVGLPACPHCGVSDSYEEGQDPMAKITVHGGASHEAEIPADTAPAATTAPAAEPGPPTDDTPTESGGPVGPSASTRRRRSRATK